MNQLQRNSDLLMLMRRKYVQKPACGRGQKGRCYGLQVGCYGLQVTGAMGYRSQKSGCYGLQVVKKSGCYGLQVGCYRLQVVKKAGAMGYRSPFFEPERHQK